jgi:hypothetical protein
MTEAFGATKSHCVLRETPVSRMVFGFDRIIDDRMMKKMLS